MSANVDICEELKNVILDSNNEMPHAAQIVEIAQTLKDISNELEYNYRRRRERGEMEWRHANMRRVWDNYVQFMTSTGGMVLLHTAVAIMIFVHR